MQNTGEKKQRSYERLMDGHVFVWGWLVLASTLSYSSLGALLVLLFGLVSNKQHNEPICYNVLNGVINHETLASLHEPLPPAPFSATTRPGGDNT